MDTIDEPTKAYQQIKVRHRRGLKDWHKRGIFYLVMGTLFLVVTIPTFLMFVFFDEARGRYLLMLLGYIFIFMGATTFFEGIIMDGD